MAVATGGIIPYRRITNPLILPVNTTSTLFQVPANYIPADATSFRVTNPNNFWVRLRGETDAAQAQNLTINATQGWLFPPGFSGTFTTQFPVTMATIGVSMMGIPAGTGTLEISYGVGGGGESAWSMPGGSASAPSGTQNVAVQNFPAVQQVADNGGSLTVDGTVNVGNFPATQPISGTVAVNNFPATQPVSGTVSATQSGTWTVGVNNFPATQQVGDAGGSLTIDSPQLPVSLGAKTAAASFSVTPATDALYTTIDRGSPSIATNQVAVTQGTAIQVVAARAGRRKVTLSPTTNIPYLVGTTGLTSTNGFAVLSGGAITMDTSAAIFVIAGNNGTMTFMETF